MGGVKAEIWGGPSNTKAAVDDTLSLRVVAFPAPAIAPHPVLPFVQFMTDDGLSSGSEDMQQAGTLAAPVEFWIPASSTADRWITSISFEIADQNATLNLFGTVAALTNGCRLYYDHPSGEIDIAGVDGVAGGTALQSNWDFVRLCDGQPAFGTTTSAFRASNVSGNSEGYIPILDLKTWMPPFGFKLDKGSNQRLVLEVRDTTTGVDSFNAFVKGFDRLPA